MNELDFLKVFYEKLRGRDSFVADIDAVLSALPQEVKVTSIPFSTSNSPAADFPLVRSDKRKVTLLRRFEGLQLFELRFTYEDADHKRTETGKFFVFEHPTYANVYAAITIEVRSSTKDCCAFSARNRPKWLSASCPMLG